MKQFLIAIAVAVSAGVAHAGPTLLTNGSFGAAAISLSIGVRIQELRTNQAGMGLDNVVLAAAVPEPGPGC